jgi:hypothetical protein
VKAQFLASLAAGVLAAALLGPSVPTHAQQLWLPNGSGGTTFNNPQGSMLGTANERMLQQHMQRQNPNWPGSAAPGSGSRNSQPAAAASSDPSFRLGNRSKTRINEIYVSSSSEANWGADHLGQNILEPGGVIIIRLPQGQCVNDIRVVYASGQATERRQVNTCSLTDLSFP